MSRSPLIDRANQHLFQPPLYPLAAGILSKGQLPTHFPYLTRLMTWTSRSVALLSVVAAFATSAFAQAQDIHVVDVPLVASAQIQFFRLPWPSTRVLVKKMVQDNHGFLWLSAADGLRRYDGYGFMRVPDSQTPRSIGFIIADSLMKDRSGRIWIGADDSLGLYDPATGSFKQYRPPDEACGTVAIAHDITEDQDGLIWLATDDGITALDPVTARTTCYRPRHTPSIGEKRVIATLPARDGTLWITSSAGLYTLDRRSGKVTRHIRLETSSGRTFRCMGFPAKPFQDSTGTIWVGLLAGGDLASINPASGAITVYSFQGSALAPNSSSGVVSIQEDQDAALWLATDKLGLVKLTPDRKQAIWYQANPDDPNGLGGDLVVGLLRDREGTFWSTTKTGDVHRFLPQGPAFRSYRHQRRTPHSLDEGSVTAAYVEDRDTLWIGTNRGLNRVDRRTDQVTRYDDPVFSRGVHAIAKDHRGDLWFGTHGNGLVRLDPRSGRYRIYAHVASDPRSLSYDRIAALRIDRGGTLWVATDFGLNRFDPATEEFRKYSPKPKSLTQYRSIAEGPGGVLWLATSSRGLHRFDPATGTFTTYEHSSRDPHSLGHNLAKFTPPDGRFTSYDSRSGLPTDTVLGILEDEHARLWVSTHDGLSRFDPRAQTFSNYHASDGLLTDLFDVPVVATKSPSGEMFFGSHSGLVAFFPDQVTEQKFVPPVVLTAFRLFGKPVQAGEGPLTQPIWSATSLELQARSIFSFDFAALNYVDPSRTRYRYRLEGLEGKWNETGGSHRTATYTTLPPGDYTLRVQARVARGDWTANSVALQLRILPPWYATWYFRSLCAALLLTVLWLAYHRRVRQLQRKSRELRDMIETIPAMAWTARPDGSDRFVNKQWAEFTGLSAHDPTASGWTDAVHPEDRRAYADAWRASLAAGAPFESEARFRSVSGEYRWLLARAVPLRDAHGQIIRWYGLLTDITDRKRAEEQRERLREIEAELAHINRVSMMGELAASIAHEVNQPLSGVVSNGSACLRWLAANVPNLDEARDAARRIVRDGTRAAEVITRIRTLTRRASAPRQRLDLNESIRDVLVLIADKATREDVNIRTDLEDDVFPVSGDRVQLQQVVLNLVLNAIEAMSTVGERPRELLLRTRNIEDGVQVTVEDSGPGLDPTGMEKIFDPFYTIKASGMGMGLSICQSIVQSHGGRLWATAKDGPGTIFDFTLPKYRGEAPHAGVEGV
jgi:PAS domain S-box-containing protein